MGKREYNIKSLKSQIVFGIALFSLVMGAATIAGASGAPTRPYTVTRWVEGWTYPVTVEPVEGEPVEGEPVEGEPVEGEPAVPTLNVTLRITTDAADTAGLLTMTISEALMPTPEAWVPITLIDPSGRVTYEAPVPGVHSTHDFIVDLQNSLPQVFEFSYSVPVPPGMTGLVRITALTPLITYDDAIYTQGTPIHSNVVTDLYPPTPTGVPDFTESDQEAVDNFIAQLTQQGEEEGWTFDVADTQIIRRDTQALLGTGLQFRPSEKERKIIIFPKNGAKDLPATYDCRDYGPEVPVSDQGNCGSCWAFSLVGVAERLVAMKDNVSVQFSEQWVLNCNLEGWGCNGGWDPYSMFVDADSCGEAGLVLEAVLPYQEETTSCQCSTSKTNPYAFTYVGTLDEGKPLEERINEIKQAIFTYGPVWTVVHAGSSQFLAYSGGIFNYTAAGAKIDHAVVIEGWDDTKGKAGVWILRNSWSELWGDEGYMYIEYDSSLVGSYPDVMSYAGSPNGSVTVTIVPQGAVDEGAQWRVDDGAWLSSGAVSPNMVPGDYTINFKTVEEYTTPADIAVTLLERENENLTGTYVSTDDDDDEDEGEETEDELESLEEIAAYLLDEFSEYDANDNGLRIDEVQEALPYITPAQFDLLDEDGDGFITRAELQAYINGPQEPACCGSSNKSNSVGKQIKGFFGDWILVGLSITVLIGFAGMQKVK